MSVPAPELLFSVPAVDLHQVINGQQKYLSQGPFNVSLENNPTGQVMVAEVPGYKWQVATHLACLKSNEFTYIFSVENAPEFFYCILLAADTPKEIQDALDQFLGAVTAFTTSLPVVAVPGAPTSVVTPPPTAPAPSSSSRLAAGITSGSAIVAAGLMKAAELAAKGIEKGAKIAVEKTKPLDKASQISPQTTANLERAKMLAATVATFSKTVASGVGSMAATVAGSIVDSVSQSTMVKHVSAHHPTGVSTVGEVGQASLLAISHLLDAMEHAARTVVRSSSSAAAKVIEHRYGAEAGAASRTGLDAAKHMLEAALAMKQLKAKAILKVTAKHTASGLILGAGSSPAPGADIGSIPPSPALQMSAVPAAYQLPVPSVMDGVPIAPQQPGAPAAPAAVDAAQAYPTAYAQPGGAYPAYPQPQ